MLLKPAIRARLLGDASIAALVGTRVYSRWVGKDRAKPLIVISCPMRRRIDALDGPGDTWHARIAVDVFDTNGDRADRLARLVEARLSGWSQPTGSPAISSCRLSEDDPETESLIEPEDGSAEAVMVSTQTYEIWFTNET